MFVLQSLQVYITNLDTSVGVIMMEKDPPHNLETCIGTILSCRNKVDIDELGAVRFSALILTLRSARCWTANTRAKSPCSRTAAIRTSSSASLRAFLPTSTWRTRWSKSSTPAASTTVLLPSFSHSRPFYAQSQSRTSKPDRAPRGYRHHSSLPRKQSPRESSLPRTPAARCVPFFPRGKSEPSVPEHPRGTAVPSEFRGSWAESVPEHPRGTRVTAKRGNGRAIPAAGARIWGRNRGETAAFGHVAAVCARRRLVPFVVVCLLETEGNEWLRVRERKRLHIGRE